MSVASHTSPILSSNRSLSVSHILCLSFPLSFNRVSVLPTLSVFPPRCLPSLSNPPPSTRSIFISPLLPVFLYLQSLLSVSLSLLVLPPGMTVLCEQLPVVHTGTQRRTTEVWKTTDSTSQHAAGACFLSSYTTPRRGESCPDVDSSC